MKRPLAALALSVFFLMPVSARAASFSWSTPWSTGSFSTDASSTLGTSGSVNVNNTAVDWSLALDRGTKTGSASAAVNGLDFSANFDWNDLLSWLFL